MDRHFFNASRIEGKKGDKRGDRDDKYLASGFIGVQVPRCLQPASPQSNPPLADVTAASPVGAEPLRRSSAWTEAVSKQ